MIHDKILIKIYTNNGLSPNDAKKLLRKVREEVRKVKEEKHAKK